MTLPPQFTDRTRTEEVQVGRLRLPGLLSRPPDAVSLVVFADLAGSALEKIVTPTLLIVGGNDHGVLELNQYAFGRLKTVSRLEIVPGATHLFPEPGAMERVTKLAAGWFERYLGGPTRQ